MFFMKFFIYCKIWKCTFPFKLSLQVFCLYIVQAYNISLFLINQASILSFTVSCGDILIAFYYIARVFFEGFFLTMVNLEVLLYIGSRMGQEKKTVNLYCISFPQPMLHVAKSSVGSVIFQAQPSSCWVEVIDFSGFLWCGEL